MTPEEQEACRRAFEIHEKEYFDNLSTYTGKLGHTVYHNDDAELREAIEVMNRTWSGYQNAKDIIIQSAESAQGWRDADKQGQKNMRELWQMYSDMKRENERLCAGLFDLRRVANTEADVSTKLILLIGIIKTLTEDKAGW